MGWRKRCVEFARVRELIDNENNWLFLDSIMTSLIQICDKYAAEDEDFGEDFERLAEEMREGYEGNDDFGLEDAEFWLDEFYDLCDSARVWLEL